MTDLAALIARLEAATEGSWDLDCDIMEAIGLPDTFFGSKVVRWTRLPRGWNCETEDGYLHRDARLAPTFSQSHDAALSLAKPPGHPLWTYRLSAQFSGSGRDWHQFEITVPSSEWRAYGHTPPLAICAAALRMLSDPRIIAIKGAA